MPDEQNPDTGHGSARIRNVPIQIEPRQQYRHTDNIDTNYSNRYDDSMANRQHYYDRDHRQDADSNHQDNYSSYTLPNNSNNTSNINIQYKPERPNRPHSSAREHQTRPESTHADGQYDPYYRGEGNQSGNQSSNQSGNRLATGNLGETKRPAHSINSRTHAGKNKENQKSRRHRQNYSPDNDDSGKLVHSPEPIPLPGPSSPEQHHQQDSAEHQQTSGEQHQHPQQQHNLNQEDQQQEAPTEHNQTNTMQQSEAKKPKGEQDPQSAINSVKSDVIKLVKDIANFEGISKDMKEYRYIEEMLTRCLIQLDSIQCSGQDLRQQRKSTVKSIESAIDVLSKRAKLNADMKQLYENLGLNASV